MNFQTSIKTCFTKYADFTGRATRSEYWWFCLFATIVNIIASMISPVLSGILALALLLPSIAVMVRRLHDDNISGWLGLILLVPLIGFLVILYFMVIEGTQGPNKFGNPAAL